MIYPLLLQFFTRVLSIHGTLLDRLTKVIPIVRKFRMFQPKLVRYLVFFKTVPTELNPKAKRTLVKEMGKVMEDTAILEDRGSIVVECIEDLTRLDPPSTQESSEGAGRWVELTTDQINERVEQSERMDKKVWSILSGYISSTEFVKSYSVLVCGSTRNYWTETQIDMSEFRVMSGHEERTFDHLSSQPRIHQLNQELTGERFIHGNRILGTKFDSRIFALGGSSSWEPEKVYTRFLLDIQEDWGTQQHQGLLGVSLFNQTVRTLLTKLSQLILSFSLILRIFKKPYQEMVTRSEEVRELAHQLQTQINTLLHVERDLPANSNNKKQDDENILGSLKVEDLPPEETLINRASMYFALVNELDQEIIRLLKDLVGYSKKLEKSFSLLVLDGLKETDDFRDIIPSILDETRRFAQNVETNFVNLRDDIHSAQSNLSNAIEVLKTFLESKQRTTSEKSERAINRLTIIFLCFGLADSISNFVIYYLEKGASMTAAREAVIWLSIVLGLLLVFASLAILIIYRKK